MHHAAVMRRATYWGQQANAAEHAGDTAKWLAFIEGAELAQMLLTANPTEQRAMLAYAQAAFDQMLDASEVI